MSQFAILKQPLKTNLSNVVRSTKPRSKTPTRGNSRTRSPSPYTTGIFTLKSEMYKNASANSSNTSVLLDSQETGQTIKQNEKTNLSKDLGNIILLIILYLIQGIPVGLVLGSIPYLLKAMPNSSLTYGDIGIFTITAYPYSLKLLWSPFVDSIYFKSIGRRKSWIIPIQTCLGLLFLYLSNNIDQLLDPKNIDVVYLTLVFGLMILLSATQDIAVDGKLVYSVLI
jgi:hypothetical protein